MRSGLEKASTTSMISFDMRLTSLANHAHMSANTSRFSLAILLDGCEDRARAAVMTWGP